MTHETNQQKFRRRLKAHPISDFCFPNFSFSFYARHKKKAAGLAYRKSRFYSPAQPVFRFRANSQFRHGVQRPANLVQEDCTPSAQPQLDIIMDKKIPQAAPVESPTPEPGKMPVIEYRDPSALRPHPIIKPFPRWAKDSPEWDAFVDDIREFGIKTPLKITFDGQVVDGETRRQAAKQLQFITVPCEIVGDDEIYDIVFREVSFRRSMTKGQQAYVLFPLSKPAFEVSMQRRISNLNNAKNGLETQLPAFRGKGLSEWVAEKGFSEEIFRQVRCLFDHFAKFPEPEMFGDNTKPMTLKDWVEARLFDPEHPLGIGALNKAVGSFVMGIKNPSKIKGGKPQGEEEQLKLFTAALDTEVSRWNYWEKFDDDTKAEHFKSVRVKAMQLGSAKCSALSEYHARLSREFAKVAKQGSAEGKLEELGLMTPLAEDESEGSETKLERAEQVAPFIIRRDFNDTYLSQNGAWTNRPAKARTFASREAAQSFIDTQARLKEGHSVQHLGDMILKHKEESR